MDHSGFSAGILIGRRLFILYDRVILTIGKRQGFFLWMNIPLVEEYFEEYSSGAAWILTCVIDGFLLQSCRVLSCRSRSARRARTPRTRRSNTSGTCTCTAPSAAPAASCSRGCSTAGRSRRYPSSSETLAQFYNKLIKFVSLFQIIDILLSTGW